MSTRDTVTRSFQYSDAEFDQIVTNMKNLIPQLTSGWTNTNNTDLGITLIHAFAGIADMLVYYLNEQAKETYLPTARIRQSVIDITSLIGYDLARPKAPSTFIDVRLPAGRTDDLYIPKYHRFFTKENVGFTAIKDYVIPASSDIQRVDLYQGEPKVEFFTATGEEHQEYALGTSNLAHDLLEVTVTLGDVTDEYGELYESVYIRNNSRRYVKVKTDMFHNSVLEFDTAYGPVPVAGSSIRVRYIETLGPDGRMARGTITDSEMTFPAGTVFHHYEDVTGGAARETVKQAKVQAPREIRTLWRAVTTEDYAALFDGYPGVMSSHVLDNEDDPSIALHRVLIYVLTDDGEPMSDLFKTELQAFADQVKMTSTRPEVRDMPRKEMEIDLDIYVYRGYDPDKVRLEAIDALKEAFHPKNRTSGETIYESMITTPVDNVPGVSHIVPKNLADPITLDRIERVKVTNITVSVAGMV